MKRFTYLFTCLLFVSLATLSSCGGGGDDTPDLTPEEQRLLDLAGNGGVTWVATSITFDGAPADGFNNFSLTLRGTATSKSYSTVSGAPVFGASGTWDFNNGNLSQILIDGNSDNVFTISGLNTVASPARVTITVNFTTPPGGAAAGTDGLYVFNLEAQ